MAILLTDPSVLKRRRWFAGIVLLVVLIAIIVVNRSRVNYIGLSSFAVCAGATLTLEARLKQSTSKFVFFALQWLLLLGILLSLDFIIYESITKSWEAVVASFFGTSGLTMFQGKDRGSTE